MKIINAQCQTDSTSSRSSNATRYVLGALAAMAALPMVAPDAQADEAPASKVNWLLNFEFSDKYLTPRGMIVQDAGLVFQPLCLALPSFYKSENFSVTGVGGVWSCFGTEPLAASGGGETHFYEVDPIAGVSFGIMKDFTLSVTYTAFAMQIFDIGTSQHLETKLAFDDSKYLKAFAIHPYFLYWQELVNKAVANTDSNPKESYYLEFGGAPSYTFEKISLKLEAPCRALLPNENFYGTGAGSSSTVGLYELGGKATIPLSFMPEGYGHWSFHAGVRWMDFVDKNLKATQGKSEVWQVYAGISSFF